MNVLVACEESQAVTTEFRRLGHTAWSCDVLPCSGGHPEWHIQGDVLPLLNGDTRFETLDGKEHIIVGKWDILIAFPPCTHLCSAGQHWFSRGYKDPCLREQAVVFFMKFVEADCEKIAIENPVGIMSSRYRKPDCKIQPWQFGHPFSKTTCLWLKGLNPLVPTEILKKPETGWLNQNISGNGKYTGFRTVDERGKVLGWNNPKTAMVRSKTFSGVAKAMACQWGG